MCTVTFIAKGKNDFILTSSRDEAPERGTIRPLEYIEDKVKLIYPKDKVAGGTWIGVSEKNRLINLLNGAFLPHKRKPNYRMSRGVVVKKLLLARDAVQTIYDFNFEGIEPFTLILIEWNSRLKLYELVWDGLNTHFKELNLSNHIWSSSLLYSDEIKSIRKQWLTAFLKNNRVNSTSLWDFHHTAGVGNKEIDLQMDRGFVKTVSISQIEKKGELVVVTYKDLRSGLVKKIKQN